MDVPLHVCEARDPKGLYKLARAGKIKGIVCQLDLSLLCFCELTFCIRKLIMMDEGGLWNI